MPVAEDSLKYTAFVTLDGHYEVKYVPSVNVFCRFISYVFRDLIKDATIAMYIDDIIIPFKDVDEGVINLKRVLEVRSRYGIRYQMERCQLLERKVNFLGYVIEAGTIKASE